MFAVIHYYENGVHHHDYRRVGNMLLVADNKEYIKDNLDNFFFADKPSAAASKAYTVYVKKFKNPEDLPPDVIIRMKEVHKSIKTPSTIFTYKCNREKLDPPGEIVIKYKETGQDKKFVYHYRNRVKLVNETMA